MQNFEDWEFDLRLSNGRVIWRNESLRPGAVQYRELGNVETVTKVKERRTLTREG